ncbi:MAG: hypothetical protein RL326_1535, partial [Pseudomonadota bacterium]
PRVLTRRLPRSPEEGALVDTVEADCQSHYQQAVKRYDIRQGIEIPHYFASRIHARYVIDNRLAAPAVFVMDVCVCKTATLHQEDALGWCKSLKT